MKSASSVPGPISLFKSTSISTSTSIFNSTSTFIASVASVAFSILVPINSFAQSAPEWSQFIPDKNPPAKTVDLKALRKIPGSAKEYSFEHIDDKHNPPDWFPADHAPMPPVVANGRPGPVMACASCHLASGLGHPESARLAGLSSEFIVQQLNDYKSGQRQVLNRLGPVEAMEALSKAITPEDMKAAGDWFAALKPVVWYTVVETDTVPASYVTASWARRVLPGNVMEPLGQRIIELPKDVDRVDKRDPHSGFTAYVPKGSIAAGRELVATGGGKAPPCAACHGANLTSGLVGPNIAGLGPTYTVRQMHAYRNSERTGPGADAMVAVAAKLTDADILSIAAYVASLDPAAK